MDAARHYATAITLLRGTDAGPPVDPATLVGMDVPSLVELNDVRRLAARAQMPSKQCPGTPLVSEGTEVGYWLATPRPYQCVHHYALQHTENGTVRCWSCPAHHVTLSQIMLLRLAMPLQNHHARPVDLNR